MVDEKLIAEIKSNFSSKDAEEIIFNLYMGDSVDSAIQKLFL